MMAYGLFPTVRDHLRSRPRLAGAIFYFLLLLIGALFFTGCVSLQDPLDKGTFYRYDMALTVDGAKFDGVAVVPLKGEGASYEITIESYDDMDMLSIRSCSREWPISGAIEQGWFKRKRAYVFKYEPNELEAEPGCPLHLGGFDKAAGRHSWGYIDFNDPSMKLDAEITCNGYPGERVDGVGACQTHAGLETLLRFEAPVELFREAIKPDCAPPEPEGDKKEWRFNMPHGICTLIFGEIGGKDRFFRLNLIGYDEIVIRRQP